MYCTNLQDPTIRLCLALGACNFFLLLLIYTCFVIVVPLCLSIYLKSLLLLFFFFDFFDSKQNVIVELKFSFL